MNRFQRLDAQTLVAGQIASADVAEAAAAGVKTIVNNRPDGEELSQPTSREIEAASRAAGLGYRYIPIITNFSPAQIETMAEALEQGPVLAFCRSGSRSTWLWALARARQGEDVDTIVGAAAEAGYDLTRLRPYLVPQA
jgi:uncharacterized protein (TIGR01244 family)